MEEYTKYAENYYYDTSDIANVLLHLTKEENENIFQELGEGLFRLQTMAQNQYNSDCFRVLWNVLQKVTENNL